MCELMNRVRTSLYPRGNSKGPVWKVALGALCCMAIHYHVLLAVREGAGEIALDRNEWQRYKAALTRWQEAGRPGRFRWSWESATAGLRAEMRYWGRKARAYGFGRVTVLPVFSQEQVLARYYSKYIAKDFQQRDTRDKGARLVEFSRKGCRIATTHFAWGSMRARLWRLKVGYLAQCCGITDMAVFTRRFGKRWAYRLKDMILDLKLPIYPDQESAEADSDLRFRRAMASESIGQR